jgi:hypothetical protein
VSEHPFDFHSVKVESVTDGYQPVCTCGWRGRVTDRMSDDYAYTNAREAGERHFREIERQRSTPSAKRGAAEVSRKHWRCFHCDEVFHTHVDAENHFGKRQGDEPACRIKAAGEFALLQALRSAQEDLCRYWAEDSDILRAMHSMIADHQLALRREEEKGYERGVIDRTKEFKNFHRLLCERFGYGHDPIDWQRDQLSLIEHIAEHYTSTVSADDETR